MGCSIWSLFIIISAYKIGEVTSSIMFVCVVSAELLQK